MPQFACSTAAVSPAPELCTFCTAEGELAGVMIVDRQDGALVVAGLYVMEPFRRGRTAAALIQRTLQEAQRLCPPKTEVFVSAVTRESFALCDKLFRRTSATRKETELMSVYHV